MKSYTLDEVYGINRDIPINYVQRNHVDDTLVENLLRKNHIIIYGSSKQGKTCLRKKHIKDEDIISVHCSNRLDIASLNQQILKAAGFQVTSSNNKTITGRAKANATFSLGLIGKLTGETEIEGEIENQTIKRPLELDLEDTNEIILALSSVGFKKYVLLEDFHYLQPDTQKDFTYALKAYYERSSIVFIIIGVWMEENKLIAINGDLAGRLISINAELWTEDNLKEVIFKGAEKLNVVLDNLADEIIEESFNNVYIVQELCYRICKYYRITKTLSERFHISEPIYKGVDMIYSSSPRITPITQIVKDIISQHTGRYNSFLIQFSDGFQNTEMETYKWLLYPILMLDLGELEKGISFNKISDLIKQKHPQGYNLNPNKLLVALKSLTVLQNEKNIAPNILEFDMSSMRLNIVDKIFLIWLFYQDRQSFCERMNFTQ